MSPMKAVTSLMRVRCRGHCGQKVREIFPLLPLRGSSKPSVSDGISAVRGYNLSEGWRRCPFPDTGSRISASHASWEQLTV